MLFWEGHNKFAHSCRREIFVGWFLSQGEEFYLNFSSFFWGREGGDMFLIFFMVVFTISLIFPSMLISNNQLINLNRSDIIYLNRPQIIEAKIQITSSFLRSQNHGKFWNFSRLTSFFPLDVYELVSLSSLLFLIKIFQVRRWLPMASQSA